MMQAPLRSIVLAFAAAAAPLAAQESRNGVQTLHFEAGALELRALVDRSAEFLGWNVLVSEQEFGNGGVAFQLQNAVDLDHDGCQEFLTTMLSTRSFVVRTLDADKKLYEVVSLMGPRAREVFSAPPQRSVLEVLAHPTLRVPVAVAVQLEHINAMIASNALRPFFASTGSPMSNLTIGSGGGSSTLLISGMQDQVANAVRIVQQCDVKQPEGVDMNGMPMQPSPVIAAMQERIAKLEKAIVRLEKLLKVQENEKNEKKER